jgi:hypothetical protein
VDLFLAISQGTGTALATGLRAFLPPLAVSALASANAGVDFDGTDFEFLESTPFLVALLAFAVAGVLLERAPAARRYERFLVVPAVALGALFFAGSLAEEGYASVPGLFAGAAVALLGYVAARLFFGGARARLDSRGETASAGYLNLYADAAALTLAVVSLFVPPLSYVAVAFCVWLLLERRRRSGRKYEGLRILR